ncbi:hypothetical protein EYF80_000504 [Liparis tanakae]|uniref:Uncharacterized protein n=1 Tax=Liparis tanakae TaxID=230148 RepID=A0A4Z2JG40_9TELE|nr:hypothetical protein EYF80_000504 [Liparis tanakae]
MLVVQMLLPDPSLISNVGTEEELPLEQDFLLLRKGAAGSVKEPLPGAGPLRSGFTFSFSAEDGEEKDKFNRAELQTKKTNRKRLGRGQELPSIDNPLAFSLPFRLAEEAVKERSAHCVSDILSSRFSATDFSFISMGMRSPPAGSAPPERGVFGCPHGAHLNGSGLREGDKGSGAQQSTEGRPEREPARPRRSQVVHSSIWHSSDNRWRQSVSLSSNQTLGSSPPLGRERWQKLHAARALPGCGLVGKKEPTSDSRLNGASQRCRDRLLCS